MTGGGCQEPPPPPLTGGEFLLQLVQKPQQNPTQIPTSPSPLQHHGVSLDPAVAAVGPTVPFPINGASSSLLYPPNFFLHGFQQNLPWPQHDHHLPSPSVPPPLALAAASDLQFNFHRQQQHQEQSKLVLGKTPFNVVHQNEGLNNLPPNFDVRGKREVGLVLGDRAVNGADPNWGLEPPVNSELRKNGMGFRSPETGQQLGPPLGFSGQPASNRRSEFESNVVRKQNSCSDMSFSHRDLLHRNKDHWKQKRFGEREKSGEVGHNNSSSANNGNDRRVHDDEISDLSEQLGNSLLVEDEADEISEKRKHQDKDFRSDPRGMRTLTQRMRNFRRWVQCRGDIHKLNSPLLEIYESLIPVEEEKAKQKQLLTQLEKLVCREWPDARLFLYGSCANSFGFSKSDIDVCFASGDLDINKSEVLLKLTELLQSYKLENVQALPRARVPIVKLKDPVTGISCDICINNVLAVVNTKLLRDYAEIDVRLRQLVFIVKHWAKCRGVNEAYQGTLSSYAYVLMCIHFLQQRRPAILPCLQGMEATYVVTVDGVECACFDKIERLKNFGSRNTESIAQLVWAFFHYWAYCHDYTNSVISVRTGSILSKQEKDWTRRIGNDRHLICIEDPFETSHDLGRVVDKHSIKVLREEFERAAEILQCDPNPCVELFKPYVSS